MADTRTPHPKAFLSYAWTSDEHISRVLALAERLTQDGVEVVVDQWDLQPGHDAFAFMEKMVTDPSVTKVIMVSNKAYSDKADSRTGGAGTEAQIISPALYGATDQDKFALVAFELDEQGKPFVPTFYKSRIYINLADDVAYESEYDRLLRWAWGKPLHVRPQLGEIPQHLSDSGAAKSQSRSSFLRAMDAMRPGRIDGAARLAEFRDQAFLHLKSKTLQSGGKSTFDEDVVASIDDLKPFVSEAQSLLLESIRSRQPSDWFETYLTLLESVQSLSWRPSHVNQWSDWDFDNFKFIAHEMLLSSAAILLKEQQFESFARLTAYRFGSVDPTSIREYTHDFSRFFHWLTSMQSRNNRLRAERANLHSDVLGARYVSSPITIKEMAQADLMLFLKDAAVAMAGENKRPSWVPIMLLNLEDRYRPLPLFSKSESRRIGNGLAAALGLSDTKKLQATVARVIELGWTPRLGPFFELDLSVLTNLQRLGIYE